MAHTPGPWSVERVDYPKKRDVNFEIVGGGYFVAQTIMREIATEADRIAVDEANVRLIAASPALLEALEIAADALDNYSDVNDGEDGPVPNTAMSALVQVRAAIEKAVAK